MAKADILIIPCERRLVFISGTISMDKKLEKKVKIYVIRFLLAVKIPICVAVSFLEEAHSALSTLEYDRHTCINPLGVGLHLSHLKKKRKKQRLQHDYVDRKQPLFRQSSTDST